MAPRETGNNAYSKFWGDKQRVLWYVVVFSGVVNFTDTSFPHCFISTPDSLKRIMYKCIFLDAERYS